jgi:hypothetical protein
MSDIQSQVLLVRLLGRPLYEFKEHQEAELDVPILYKFDRMAYIFAFCHEGRYMPFQVPAMFLVNGRGQPVHKDGKVDLVQLGLASLEPNIVFASDLRFWAVDRWNFVVRLDVNSGPLQKVVINAETAGGSGRRIDLVGQDSSFTARLS